MALDHHCSVRKREGSFVFTVFTPTYNRAHTLKRVYDSLCAQSFRDFEWLIVDDGSTDGTGELIKAWKDRSGFPMRYLRQEKQGKHAAFNRGVREAYGELFLPLDSDDGCTPDALARFKHHWDAIPAGERLKFTGVTALCMDESGKTVGGAFPADVFDSDSLEITYKFGVTGEKWGFHRTEVLREFPFPVMAGVQFCPEGIVWSTIARKYKTRFVNERLRIYYRDDRWGGQLTRAGFPGRHAVSLALWHCSVLNDHLDWFRHAPVRFLMSAIHYVRFSFHAGLDIPGQIDKLKRPLARLLYVFGLPMGWLAYKKDGGGAAGWR
ncbi:MAG: glycosyltransferase family 2 protein [Nitrospiraceae bacterium]|nr:glycosyltransferase family 2 protein [Nitrospiraceae bacterium]